MQGVTQIAFEKASLGGKKYDVKQIGKDGLYIWEDLKAPKGKLRKAKGSREKSLGKFFFFFFF